MKVRLSWIFLGLLLITNFNLISGEEDEDYGGDEGDEDEYVTIEEEDEQSKPALAVPAEEEVEEYYSPIPDGNYYLHENFDDPDLFKERWVRSEAKKEDTDDLIAKYDGVWKLEEAQRDPVTGDEGLVLKSKAKHAAIATLLDKPFLFSDRPFVVQYEVNLQNGQECGGAYLKLLSLDPNPKTRKPINLKEFHDKTPYTIMFGPDKCGNDNKLHFIFRHKNPLNGSFEEKHAKKPKERIEEPFKDKRPHLYTLVINPDNSFSVSVDHKVVNKGSLLEDVSPPVNPLAEIDDPNDFKPNDWDEREKIPDPEARKPDDWDEDAPAQIPDETAEKPIGWLDDEPDNIADPNAEKPEDWDVDMDGEWEAPLIPNPMCESAAGCGQWTRPLIDNPNYKGKWRPPLIDNPNYKGKWRPRRISNPDYFEDLQPFLMTPIGAVGFELWSMSDNIMFDNLIITDSLIVAEQYAADSFDIKRIKLDKQAQTWWGKMMRRMNYKPGYWGIYFIYCLIPISCYVWYLYRRSKEDTQADAKKTDAPQPDDEEVEEPKKPASKGQLETPVNGAGDAEEENEEEGSGEEDEEEEEEDEEEAEESEDNKTDAKVPTTTARQRRPRKE
ncbi:calnexin isoform X2 [Neocloeon triangulifer]|uniref:calnexin isoform X2 n=1 Tax=Neocloeon triangulifer TaxID=2078957 RepID=UPI00286EC91E|nr:calnexin isoform X2 [Neocloeon triangulifer]